MYVMSTVRRTTVRRRLEPEFDRVATTVTRKVNVPRGVRSKVVAIRRGVALNPILSNTSTFESFGSQTYQLTDLPAYTDFTNLFDQYRIVKVKLDYFPRYTGNMTSTGLYSLLTYAVDSTDVSVPVNKNEVLQYDSYKTVQAYRPFSVTLKPAPSVAMYQSLATTGYGPKQGSWVDCKSPGVQHYGMKWVFECNSGTAMGIDVKATYWCEFREPN